MTDSIYKGEDFEDKVRKQVEFYFSDSNLQTDKFLWKIYEANDGWVELKTILTFSRMRQYRPEEKVIAALKDSSELVVSTNEDMVRRKEPVKDFNEVKNIRKRNTVHIEGFPKDVSQEDLESWFHTKIVPNLPEDQIIVSLRRIRSKAKREFFGVVDVEFKSQKDVEFILNNIEISYPQGIVKEGEEGYDSKTVLKKMSLLTFQEMRETGKRFGVNDVTKRRNSFNDNHRGGNKKFKKGNFKRSSNEKSDEIKETTEEPSDSKSNEEEKEAKVESKEVEKTEAQAPVEAPAAPVETPAVTTGET
ncbi:hypothetical protein DFJ63DRAFT_153134 [Scheffersomyces coipomensis]|uniref:uncharacterized protein n=1 Tax=Scheffersomyces coipomensis TaxID=1788519 RepID=UPI00315D9A10